MPENKKVLIYAELSTKQRDGSIGSHEGMIFNGKMDEDRSKTFINENTLDYDKWL